MVSPELRQGCVYRSSQVVSSSEIQALRLKAVLDLRVLKKPCRKHADLIDAELRSRSSKDQAGMLNQRHAEGTSSSDEDGYNGMHKLKSRRHSEGRKCAICTAEFGCHHNVSVPIYHSDLVPWTTKMRVFGKLPASTKIKALGEIVHFRNPEKMVAAAVVDPDVMGPQVLYKMLLDHSKSSFAIALRLFTAKENYPVLVHCIHGKDRTGLIIMLLLLICDIPTKLIVADYIQSELQLKAGRDKGDLHELDDFLKTDHVIASKAETMVETIAHLDMHYGCAKSYCKAIGLTDKEIADIRGNLKLRHPDSEAADISQGSTRDQTDRNPYMAPSDGGSPLIPVSSEGHMARANCKEWKDAKPAEAGAYTPHDECVLSGVALKAAGEAIEEKLGHPSQGYSNPKGLEGAVSVDKIPPPLGQAQH